MSMLKSDSDMSTSDIIARATENLIIKEISQTIRIRSFEPNSDSVETVRISYLENPDDPGIKYHFSVKYINFPEIVTLPEISHYFESSGPPFPILDEKIKPYFVSSYTNDEGSSIVLKCK